MKLEKLFDNQGREIVPGLEVAFNISGQLARGRVVEIKPSGSYYKKANIKIHLLHKAAGKREGHISTVTNPLNVLVLEEAPEQNALADLLTDDGVLES